MFVTHRNSSVNIKLIINIIENLIVSDYYMLHATYPFSYLISRLLNSNDSVSNSNKKTNTLNIWFTSVSIKLEVKGETQLSLRLERIF